MHKHILPRRTAQHRPVISVNWSLTLTIWWKWPVGLHITRPVLGETGPTPWRAELMRQVRDSHIKVALPAIRLIITRKTATRMYVTQWLNHLCCFHPLSERSLLYDTYNFGTNQWAPSDG